MFEKYEFDSIQLSIQPVLSLYARGLLSGIAIDSGDGVTHICPVNEGYMLPHLVDRLDVAGRDITRYLIKVCNLHRLPHCNGNIYFIHFVHLTVASIARIHL